MQLLCRISLMARSSDATCLCRDKLGVISIRQEHLARFMIAFSLFISVTGLTTSILNLIF